MHRRRLFATFGVAAVLGCPTALRAWAADQHVIVCELAFQLLSEESRSFVQRVRRDARGAGLQMGRFSEDCAWADEARHRDHLSTYEYHFANVEEDFASHFERRRDCAAFDCVAVAIVRYAEYLGREPGGFEPHRIRRGNALRFLGHFVADLHQPLHVGHASDAGGNRIYVRLAGEPEEQSLHRVWDYHLPRAAGIVSTKDVPRLLAAIERSDTRRWRDDDVWGWADESFDLAKSRAYTLPSGARVRSGDTLDRAYFDAAAPVVEGRLLQSAVRLAHLIEVIASGGKPFR